MTFRLLTFGDFRLLDPSGNSVSFPEKGLFILAYLFATPERARSRSTVSRLLWDRVDPAHAYTNLRKTLSRIEARQQELGHRFIETTAFDIKLHDSSVQCDLVELQNRTPSDAIDDLRFLTGFFERSFLENTDVTNTNLSAWIKQQRDRHLARLRESLMEAIPRASSAADIALIKDAALRVFQHDPDDEMVVTLLAEPAEGKVRTARIVFHPQKETSWGELKPGPDIHALNVVRKVFAKQRQSAPAPIQVGIDRAQAKEDTVFRRAVPRLVLLPPVESVTGNHPMLPFADALIEDVTIGLCSLTSVSVVAPYTAAQIGRHSDKADAISRHSISYVLDTRLTENDGQRALFVQLIYFANDEVIWADRYNVERDSLAVQRRQIAQRISMTITGQIERNELAREYFERRPTAYHHYLLGQRHLKHLGLPDIRRARREFRASLHDSPYFSPALSGIARTYSREWLITARGDGELLKEAEKHAHQAIEAGQDMVAGYRELGVAKLLLGGIDESVEALELAETLSPHYADVVADYADTLVHASQPRQALEKIEKAIDLNPLCPDVYLWTGAGASYCLEEYDQALSYINRMADPGLANRLSAASWAMLGNLKRARSFVRKARETHPDFDVDAWLAVVPLKEQWQKDHYRDGLRRAGF
jgi:DNA-binding SARP family transcriptional activator/tetratricopeptide (TPR) repeat protein